MPGYLSSIFDGGDESHEGQQHLGAESPTDVALEPGVHTDFSGSYEDQDGTTHEWSSSQDLDASVSLHAVLAVASDTNQGAFVGDGFEE